jgi:hypothetical protein
MLLSNLTSSASACALLISMKIPVILSPQTQNGFYPTQARCGSSPAPVPYPEGESVEVKALPLLLDAFVQGAVGSSGRVKENEEGESDKDGGDELEKKVRKGDLHFLASVFANVSTVNLFVFPPGSVYLFISD